MFYICKLAFSSLFLNCVHGASHQQRKEENMHKMCFATQIPFCVTRVQATDLHFWFPLAISSFIILLNSCFLPPVFSWGRSGGCNFFF